MGAGGAQNTVQDLLTGEGMRKDFGVRDNRVRFQQNLAGGLNAQFLHTLFDDAFNFVGIIVIAAHDQDFILGGHRFSP